VYFVYFVVKQNTVLISNHEIHESHEMKRKGTTNSHSPVST
jgi:hypothetical protein